MTTYYKATFSDGFVLKRSTASRTYTHAWRITASYTLNHPKWERNGEKGGYRNSGFSGSEALARNAARHSIDPMYYSDIVTTAEVVPAIEITRQEYKAR